MDSRPKVLCEAIAAQSQLHSRNTNLAKQNPKPVPFACLEYLGQEQECVISAHKKFLPLEVGYIVFRLKEDRFNIEKDREVVKKNMRKAEESRTEFKKLKTTAKPFLSHNCSHCQNGITFPSIYFMCGHSFH
jgi:hypothetical protein